MNLLLPEIIISLTALAAFLLDLIIRPERTRIVPYLVIAGLVAAAASLAIVSPYSGELLGGSYAVSSAHRWFKIIFVLAALSAVALAADCFEAAAGNSRLDHGNEFVVLLLLTLLGMMFLISSQDLVTIYVSLELATIPLFLLSAWSKSSLSSEAGLKYVILGALSSALLLFGMSIIYGLSGEMSLPAITSSLAPTPGYWYALALIGAGIGFKLALVPFQMWAPDVYEGAPTPVTAYLSVASKTAGVALALVLFVKLAGDHLAEWSGAIALLSALTMTLGNTAAIAQHNIKRFMAYSSISQAGYIIMGFIGAAPEGYPAVLYYLLGYLVTNVAVFAVIILYAAQTGRDEIKEYAGLSETRPLLALVMMVALFSLAGIPPLAGFTGKFFLFSVAAKAGYYWLVTLAALNSTVSLYYYLKIVRQMYIEPALDLPSTFRSSPIMVWTLCLTFAATILIGILPIFYESISAQTTGLL